MPPEKRLAEQKEMTEKDKEKKMSFAIAIDGPAGAGKSTIAKLAAKQLGFLYVDTGAMYRAVALQLIREKTDPENEEALRSALEGIEITLRYSDGVQHVLLNGEDVSSLIRTEEVSRMGSISSAKAQVRQKLLSLQQTIARENDCIMDGRDIGTKILPDALLKIFLTASVEERARRRFLEDQQKGAASTLEEVMENIRSRDERDTNREVSPLRKSEDAVLIDSSFMSIGEVVQKITGLAQERMHQEAQQTGKNG